MWLSIEAFKRQFQQIEERKKKHFRGKLATVSVAFTATPALYERVGEIKREKKRVKGIK